ncbi:MerR family transcriptional regulator [Actinoplanes sp. RD1]|uniref:MerR family transcriptional regulator n=1 Tax=Actinoplanes sp. RD1 TaxID=3064538 RepID=UPI002741E572|nr:MerR family transcriptional regulator [Actinoplanes sp. RD1]
MRSIDLRGLTIGEFGRRAGLTVKALRLYEMSGLLPPAEVDAATGYRRYALSQLERARRISLLRRLDMPLAVVAEVLDDGGEGATLLDHWWAGQEQAIQTRRNSVSWLRTQLLADGAAEPAYEVHRRHVPGVKVASVHCEADQQSLLDTIQRARWDVRQVLESAAAATTAEHWVVYHGFVTPETVAPIEVCVPFTGAVEPDRNVAIRREPAHEQLYATLFGAMASTLGKSEELALIDEVAALVIAADEGDDAAERALAARYAADARLHPGRMVTSRSPRGVVLEVDLTRNSLPVAVREL